jgi:tumor protein p53-inducible protein 3
VKAVRIHEHGGRDVLRYEDADAPAMRPGHVRVAVRAIGVNRGDIAHREGAFPVEPPKPFTLGFEFAGEAVELGENVEDFAIGDGVCGQIPYGAYAEEVVAPEAELAKIPAGVDYVEAAAFVVTFCTAWFALVRLGRAQPGESVLVHGGGSGVGTACISLGQQLDVRTIVTAGSDWKLERCRELGASEVISYAKQDFLAEVLRVTDGAGVQLVVEQIGGDVFTRSLQALARPGRIVAVGNTSGQPSTFSTIALLAKEAEIHGLYLDKRQERGETGPALREVAQLWAEGRVRPVVDQVMALEDAADAHRYLEDRSNFGKVILAP